ncbi:MAG: UvrD-helicase domain-containing protein, partial [Bifidobacteriaceae bacterium]|nr:UvrD-helicase domain-containing protein [Bifidobacteriaceae bacterium]
MSSTAHTPAAQPAYSQPALIDLARLPSIQHDPGDSGWEPAPELAPSEPEPGHGFGEEAPDAGPAAGRGSVARGGRSGGRGREQAPTGPALDIDPAALLDGLNPEQKAAVVHDGGPLLIVAGAGSGKTRVLTHRIAYLLATGRARPSEILAITFTNKAAAEMRERVEALVGPVAKRMWVSTFHSACVRILRREAATLGVKSSFSIYDTQDSLRLITMAAGALNVNPKVHPPKKLQHEISNLKNELIDPDDYDRTVHAEGTREAVIAEVYRSYQDRLRRAGAMDFDDLIMNTVGLLQAFPAVAEHYRRRFRHILVDEYQDTNYAQYVLVRELAGVGADQEDKGGIGRGELTVVGDADQSIYAFRGATVRNIIEFEQDYPDASTILLQQNYRSTQNILSAANGVIAKNPGRRPKNLWTAGGAGAKVVGYVADSQDDEARFIAREIDRLGQEDGVRPGDVAVFYRTNAQSRALEEQLMRLGLPYAVVGGTKFYDRKEVRDAVAYLRAIDNPDDTVSVRRVFNVPRRGLGDKAEQAVAAYADQHRISFGAALRAEDLPGLTPRAQHSIDTLVELLDRLSAEAQGGASAADLLQAVLEQSGYLAELNASEDVQAASRR